MCPGILLSFSVSLLRFSIKILILVLSSSYSSFLIAVSGLLIEVPNLSNNITIPSKLS